MDFQASGKFRWYLSLMFPEIKKGKLPMSMANWIADALEVRDEWERYKVWVVENAAPHTPTLTTDTDTALRGGEGMEEDR